MSTFRCLVTGSRDWLDWKVIWDALDLALAEAAYADGSDDWKFVVVHGGCPTGADAIAYDWSVIRKKTWRQHVGEEEHPARWDLLGKQAGFARNEEMVASKPDLCLAFFQPGAANRGTTHCSDLAKQAGTPVRYYGEHGTESSTES